MLYHVSHATSPFVTGIVGMSHSAQPPYSVFLNAAWVESNNEPQRAGGESGAARTHKIENGFPFRSSNAHISFSSLDDYDTLRYITYTSTTLCILYQTPFCLYIFIFMYFSIWGNHLGLLGWVGMYQYFPMLKLMESFLSIYHFLI
jgi:hypothetical protein